MPTSLQGSRAKKAAGQKGYRVRNRYGRLDEDFLEAVLARHPPGCRRWGGSGPCSGL